MINIMLLMNGLLLIMLRELDLFQRSLHRILKMSAAAGVKISSRSH